MRAWLASVRGRWRELLEEYGKVAIWTYLAMSLTVFTTFVVLIRAGYTIESATASAGTFGAAYVGLKLTQPFRMLATVAITPPIALFLRRFRREPEPEPVPALAADRPDDAA